MLDFLKKPGSAKSILVYFLFGFFAFVLVFIDAGSFISSQTLPNGNYAALVNDEKISVNELRTAYNQMTRNFANQFGGNFNLNQQQRREMAGRTLDQLIQRELLAQEAVRVGVYVTDLELANFIQSIPAFQNEGFFDKSYYKQFLKNRRTTAGQFEKDLKKSIKVSKLQELFQESLQPLSLQETKEKEAKKKQVNVEFVRFQESLISRNVKASKSEIQSLLKKEEEKVKEYFTKNQEKYSQKEQVRAKHILLKTTDPEKEAEVLKKAQSLVVRAKGESFEALAKEFSEDPGSKENGGDLGFFERGRMVKEFEDAAFSLPVGEVSEPIKSQFGYHIIRVEEKKEAKSPEFANVKESVAEDLLKERKASQAKAELAEILDQQSQSKLRKFLKKYNLKWQETGFFDLASLQIPRIGSVEGFVETAFTLNRKNPLPKTVVRQGATQYILKFKEEKNVEVGDDIQISSHSGDSFQSWLNQLSESAEIQKNPSVLKLF